MDAERSAAGAGAGVETDSSDGETETLAVSSYRFPPRSPHAGADMALLRSQFAPVTDR